MCPLSLEGKVTEMLQSPSDGSYSLAECITHDARKRYCTFAHEL